MIPTGRFSGGAPISAAQGRHGEIIIVQGNGVRPVRLDLDGEDSPQYRDAGVDAPTLATEYYFPEGEDMFYVARADVVRPGAAYYSAPEVTIAGSETPCKCAAYLSQGGVSEVVVLDGGKNYPSPPQVALSATHGSGATFEVELDGADTDDPLDDPYTGISEWRIVQAPPYLDDAGADDGLTWYKALNRSYILPAVTGSVASGLVADPSGASVNSSVSCYAYTTTLDYTVSGGGDGAGAHISVTFGGARWTCSISGTGPNYSLNRGAREVLSVKVHRLGAGYSDEEPVVITIPSASGDTTRDIIIEGYTAGSTQNTTANRYAVKSITVTNGGSGYVVAPLIKITSSSGFGAYATCQVEGGAISSVTLESGGGGYKTPPEVTAEAGGAEVFAVARPHMRGKYQCYYRYIDDTPEQYGGPIPSNLSPVTEYDAGEGRPGIWWRPTVLDTGRIHKAELWRTTSNQATTLYRVGSVTREEILDSIYFVDDLTDEELRSPDREGYAAMPIVLPNGDINANRFGVPPSDMSAVVRFQDRFWYGVNTASRPNTILYSEVDEPESVPPENEIVIQQNTRSADAVTAMVPFGSTLLVMQSRHAYSLTFAKQPVLDANVSLLAFRGALNQRCCDIHDGACYVMDQYGVYSITASGQVENLSDSIGDYFRERIDFGKSTWNFVLVDPVSRILRAFVVMKGETPVLANAPTCALCYSLDAKTWWEERYPQPITCGGLLRFSGGAYRCVHGAAGGVYALGEGAVDHAITPAVEVFLLSRGSGYTSPPEVRSESGSGSKFQASLDDEGRVKAVWIVNPGYGHASSEFLTVSPPPEGGTPAVAFLKAAPSWAIANDEAQAYAPHPAHPHYRLKTTCVEYVSDSQNPRAASESPRHVSLLYKPQPDACEVSLRTYYNNASHPRQNVAYRDRGVGFKADVIDGGSRLDMGESTVKYGADNGMARALMVGRTLDDMAGSDRHVAVELLGVRKNEDPVVFYKLDILGAEK